MQNYMSFCWCVDIFLGVEELCRIIWAFVGVLIRSPRWHWRLLACVCSAAFLSPALNETRQMPWRYSPCDADNSFIFSTLFLLRLFHLTSGFSFSPHCQIFPKILLNCRIRFLFPLCRRPSSLLKMVPIGSAETPVINYHSTVRKIPKSSDLLGLCFVNKRLCHTVSCYSGFAKGKS
jgi:hypothetical protein